jgi:hypothetical protein
MTVILYLQQLGSKGSQECEVTKELGTFTQGFNKLDIPDASSCASLLCCSFSLTFQSQCLWGTLQAKIQSALCAHGCSAVRPTTLPLASISIIISTSPLWIRGKERITAGSVNYLENAALYNLQKLKLCCSNNPRMFISWWLCIKRRMHG